MERTVTVIENTVPVLPKKKRVVAYARVSLGTDFMLHSIAAQVSYYSEMIQNNPEWEYAGVFADFDETGTKENRPEFQKMLSECRAGKVDVVITKSISRLARNTVTLLETVRELKDLGIDVFFEEQNIHTLSGEGELMLTILASYAQEESRSVSENIKWRKRNDMQAGRTKPMRIYGFDSVDGKLVINEEQAKVVRRIFDLYLAGNGHHAIATILTKEKIPSPAGLDYWNSSAVDRILHNEKMRGNLLHQCTYIENHITKKQVKNRGDLPMYLVEGTHEGIVSSEVFEKVQEETARRAEAGDLNSYDTLAFRKLIKCGCCGRSFLHTTNGQKQWKHHVWRCGGHDKRSNPAGCSSRDIPEDILIKLTCSVLGIKEFDGDMVKEQIEEIRVPEHHMLIFVMKNGSQIVRLWEPKKKGPKKKERRC